MEECLVQLEKDKFVSIAFPAIGTGKLKFPRPKVAGIFFSEVRCFFMAHPQSPINDVRFVAYHKDQSTVNAFLGLSCPFILYCVLACLATRCAIYTSSSKNVYCKCCFTHYSL